MVHSTFDPGFANRTIIQNDWTILQEMRIIYRVTEHGRYDE